MSEEQINTIAEDLDSGLKCFIHLEKKTIISLPSSEGNFLMAEMDQTLISEEQKDVMDNPGSYVEIESMDASESFKLMEEFIDTVEDTSLQDKLDRALSKSKPFRDFKSVIDNGGPYREKWFVFKHQQIVQWVKEQVLANNL